MQPLKILGICEFVLEVPSIRLAFILHYWVSRFFFLFSFSNQLGVQAISFVGESYSAEDTSEGNARNGKFEMSVRHPRADAKPETESWRTGKLSGLEHQDLACNVGSS